MLSGLFMLLSGMGKKLSTREKIRESLLEKIQKKQAASTAKERRAAYSSEGTKVFLTKHKGVLRSRFVDDIIRKVDGKKIKNTSGT